MNERGRKRFQENEVKRHDTTVVSHKRGNGQANGDMLMDGVRGGAVHVQIKDETTWNRFVSAF